MKMRLRNIQLVNATRNDDPKEIPRFARNDKGCHSEQSEESQHFPSRFRSISRGKGLLVQVPSQILHTPHCFLLLSGTLFKRACKSFPHAIEFLFLMHEDPWL